MKRALRVVLNDRELSQRTLGVGHTYLAAERGYDALDSALDQWLSDEPSNN